MNANTPAPLGARWRMTFGRWRQSLEVSSGTASKEVRDKPVIGHLEDRRLFVLVDRDDDLAVLHPREVLDRTRDADRDVEVRRHDLARLPHLPVVRRVAGIDRGTARADGGAELVGKAFDQRETVPRSRARVRPRRRSPRRSVRAGRRPRPCPRPTRTGPRPRVASTISTGAELPVPAASKVEVRKVTTFFASVDFTVWTALPA